MTQREKLIELIRHSRCCPKEIDCADCEYKKYELCTETMIASHLLTNGVVVLPCRCKECSHAKKLKNSFHGLEYSCNYFNSYSVHGDDFCSHAKRKAAN